MQQAQAIHSRVAALRTQVTDMRSLLQEQAAIGRQARRIPSTVTQRFRESGLCRVYNPRRFGGDELHMSEVLPLIATVAEACPASAWVMAIYQIHNWVVSLFPESAQQEVFAKNQDPLVCASLNPSKNSVRKVDDGYLIEAGRFTFCSGAAARDWALLGALVKNARDEVVDVGCLLVPGNELSEIDDWIVSGLQGTGSISLVAENLHVPAHRFLSYQDAVQYRTAGAKQNTGAVYRAAFVPMLVLNLAGPALGAAERAWQCFVDHLNQQGAKAGVYPLPGIPKIDAAAAHHAIAEARLKIDTAQLLLARAGATIRDEAEAGRQMPPTQSAKINLDTSYAMRECLAAVQMLLLQAGGAVLQPTHPLQHAYQDVTAINCHGFLGHEANLSLYGSLITGHAHPMAFL
jgi:3-hydroxy-9,10-secoandrosta-1,3,5(10)-triene-9,17-dione monooxygenase